MSSIYDPTTRTYADIDGPTTDPAYEPTHTALPAYAEPPTAEFPAYVPPTAARPVVVQYVEREPEPKNGFGITALICGLAGSVFGLIPILSVPAICGGLIGFGFGMGGVKRLRSGKANNKMMTIFGIIFSVISLALGVYGMYVVQKAVGDLQTDLNNLDTGVATTP